jgi:hypothetical protein
MFAPAWIVWLFMQKDRWKLLTALTAGYLPWVIIVGFGWAQLLRHLADGPRIAAAGSETQGVIARALSQFGSVFKVPGPKQLFARLVAISKLWLWASPLLILIAAPGFWRHRRNTHMKLLLVSATMTFVAYLFVPLDQGHGWGYRYFHSVWFVLPVFAGAALVAPRGTTSSGEASESSPLLPWALAATLAGLFVMTPYFSWSAHSFIATSRSQVPEADHGTPRVMIIDPTQGYYNGDLVQNDPFMRSPVIRMFSHGRDNDASMMARKFPDLVLLGADERGTVWGIPTPRAIGTP